MLVLVIDCNSHSFPPTKVEIEVEPRDPVVGAVASLKCKSDSSSPQVKMVWYRNNEFLSGAADTRTGTGNYGGVMTSSAIQTKVTEKDINAVYKCEARHVATSKSISNSTKISVQCKYHLILLFLFK